MCVCVCVYARAPARALVAGVGTRTDGIMGRLGSNVMTLSSCLYIVVSHTEHVH